MPPCTYTVYTPSGLIENMVAAAHGGIPHLSTSGVKILGNLALSGWRERYQQALRSVQAGIAFRGIGRSFRFAHNQVRPLIDDGPARAG